MIEELENGEKYTDFFFPICYEVIKQKCITMRIYYYIKFAKKKLQSKRFRDESDGNYAEKYKNSKNNTQLSAFH